MAKKAGPKRQSLRLYLIKAAVTKYADALRDPASLLSFPLKPGLGLTGQFYLRNAQPEPVEWFDFVQAGVKGVLPPITNSPNAAVLFLEVSGRIFALVFGTGRVLLKEDAYEVDFGLRSTLNAVNPRTLRSIDVHSHEAVALHKRVQTSLASNLSAFSLDMYRERVRSLTGVAKNAKVGSRVTGTEGGLGVSTEVDFAGLADKCKAYLAVYKSSDYKIAFPAFDNLRAVKDPVRLGKLNDRLVGLLRKKKTDTVHLSPPEPIDYSDFSGFSLTEKGPLQDELSIHSYLSKQTNLAGLDLDDLKRHRVYLRTEDAGDAFLDSWSVYRCLVCEIREGKSLFVLSNGEWSQVSLAFADQVHDYLKSIPESTINLPSSTTHRLEADYLEHVANTQADLALMDQKLVWCDSAGTSMEVCDLFSKAGQFVHAKRKCTGAGGYSHLFMQGRNSAIAFVRDPAFRTGARNHLAPAGAAFSALIPKDRPDPGKYEIVFAPMGEKDADFLKELPFYSKLTFMRVAEDLRAMGFKVSFKQAETPK